MNRLYSLKRILTFIIAFAVTAGIAGSSYNSSLKITSADTESSQGEDYNYTDSVADGGQQSDEQQKMTIILRRSQQVLTSHSMQNSLESYQKSRRK